MQTICRAMLSTRFHPAASAALLGLILLGLTGPLSAVRVHAQTAEPPALMMVLDGSGSMWGKLEGERQTKLVMMQQAVRKALAQVKAPLNVGLASFGHRRGGDCQDTEVLNKPLPLDLERQMTPIDKFNPRGRGPLTKALQEAAAELGGPAAAATMMLVHDGLDNCQQDPCTIIGTLKQAHPKLRVHVISLGLAPDEAAQMACLPQETGGRHFVVANEQALDAAVLEATRLASAAPGGGASGPAPNAPAGAPAKSQFAVPKGRPGLQLAAQLVRDGPPVAVPITWEVRAAGAKGAPLWTGTVPAPLLVLKTGRYDIVARSGLVVAKATAEAVSGEPRALTLVLDAGTLAFGTSDKTLSMLDDAVITLTRVEANGLGEPQILRRVASEVALPAGNYLFALTTGAIRIERPIGIEAGARVSLGGSLNLGLVEFSTIAGKGTPELDNVVIAIFEDDPDAPQGRREIARSAAINPSFKLQAGSYFVIARRGLAETRDRFTVRAGDVERRVLTLESGRVDLSIGFAGGRLQTSAPFSHRLDRLDSQGKDVAHATGATAQLDLAAGTWRLVTRVGQGNVEAQREIKLKPGDTEKIAIAHAAGSARLRLLPQAGGAPIVDVAWEIRDRNGKIVWEGLAREAHALLMEGRYLVTATARDQSLKRTIEVRAGDVLQFDLVP